MICPLFYCQILRFDIQIYPYYNILDCLKWLFGAGGTKVISARTVIGRRGLAVIERFGGCCHGFSVNRKREDKKQNQHCNRDSLAAETIQ